MSDKVSAIIEKYNADRGQLVSILQDIQDEYYYLPKEALIKISETMSIPLSQVYNVATFFKAFSLKPRGKHFINVCLGTACHVRGAVRVLEKIERSLGIRRGETTEDRRFTLETVNCMGACALGPVIRIDGEYYGQMGTEKVEPLLDSFE
ncbi:MAG TPA: NADH-quinone oxidoreductase subunit NuoE [Dehalococcoidia bacterium]|nr:NADH-quinone oxidoreductase subunit NuoE [Dehalococcoidia bacterium]